MKTVKDENIKHFHHHFKRKVKSSFSFGTLESRIYSIFTVMIFGAIFVMQLVSFQFTMNTVRNSTLNNNEVLLGQLMDQIDSYITSMQEVSIAVADSADVQHFLQDADVSDFEQQQQFPAYSAIQQRLQYYIEARGDIAHILIFGHNGAMISSDSEVKINPWSNIREKPWYIDAMAASGATVVSTAYVQNLIEGKYSWVVSLSREIISEETGESLGVLLVDLKFNRIKDLCLSLVVGDKGYNFILDRLGNYVFHPTQQLVYSELRSEPVQPIMDMLQLDESSRYQNGDRYYMVSTSELTGWHIVSVTHESDMITDWKYVQLTYSILGLLLFIIVGFATNKISAGITKPVKELQRIMKHVDTGDFHLAGNIDATDEIRELAHDYDLMVTRIRELMDENIKEQEMKRKSDLKALQAQINPHFLYNTLDSIIWMAEMGKNHEVVQMTSAMSRLFRISISKGREIISIKDEISHVESYLTIQMMRYKDKFEYFIDISPELLDFRILKITLQPLVENAIYHGIKEVDHKGLITILGELCDDRIVISVSDNGQGMDEIQLGKMRHSIENMPDAAMAPVRQGMGMGVRNVHQRIQLYFGKEYGITVESLIGKGTTVTVVIPATMLEVLA